MTTFVSANARTVPGPDGTLQQEPAYVAGWEARKARLPLIDRWRPWSAIDNVRREDRIYEQGWRDAGLSLLPKGKK